MKIHVDRKVLFTATQTVLGIVPARSTKPVLQNLKLSITPEQKALIATDMEIGLRYYLESVETLEPGEVLLPAREFAEILRESNDERIQIESTENQVIVSTERSEFCMLSESSEEYPEVPLFQEEGSFELPTETILSLVNKVSFAVGVEPTRYAINGILTEIENKTMRMVGTDGKRLAFAQRKIENQYNTVLSVIISPKGLSYIAKILQEDRQMVRVKTSNNQILFDTGRATLVSLLVEGHFPKYQDVLPDNLNKKAVLDRREFESNLRKARLMTSEDSKAVRLGFQVGQLQLSSRAPEKGQSRIDMDAEFDGDKIEIGFDPRFLLEGLKVLEGDTATLQIKDSNHPGMLVEGKDFQYVIMPISLG